MFLTEIFRLLKIQVLQEKNVEQEEVGGVEVDGNCHLVIHNAEWQRVQFSHSPCTHSDVSDASVLCCFSTRHHTRDGAFEGADQLLR